MARQNEVGDAVRRLRTQLGLTQQSAAERAKLSIEGYARIERGKRIPSLETFLKICDGLGVSPNALLEWDHPPQQDEQSELKELRQQLHARLDELDKEGLMLVDQIIDFAWRRRSI